MLIVLGIIGYLAIAVVFYSAVFYYRDNGTSEPDFFFFLAWPFLLIIAPFFFGHHKLTEVLENKRQQRLAFKRLPKKEQEQILYNKKLKKLL